MAVDPVTESAFGMLDERVAEGRYLEPDDRLAAYVGAEMVESLELRLGSRFVVQAQDTEGEIAGQLLRVVGIFNSGVPEVDRTLIHMPLATAGEWLGSKQDVTNVGGPAGRQRRHRARRRAGLEGVLADPVARGEARVMRWREAGPGARRGGGHRRLRQLPRSRRSCSPSSRSASSTPC